MYININLTNVSNMHHIADIFIKIHSNLIKLIRFDVIIILNMIFEQNYIAHNYNIFPGISDEQIIRVKIVGATEWTNSSMLCRC